MKSRVKLLPYESKMRFSGILLGSELLLKIELFPYESKICCIATDSVVLTSESFSCELTDSMASIILNHLKKLDSVLLSDVQIL